MRRIILIGLVAALLLIPAAMAAGCGPSAQCKGDRISCPKYQAGSCTPVTTGLAASLAPTLARVSYTIPLSGTGQNNCPRLMYPSSADLASSAALDAASRCCRM